MQAGPSSLSAKYIKDASPSGLFVGAAKKEFEASRTTACSPVLEKRELARHGMER
ncbi:Uncharacterized protein ToN1_42900 [Aromatoleum petrolei]|nr:Uncharacterized protein ToN1_42900 [Aromatoleum petrolei]